MAKLEAVLIGFLVATCLFLVLELTYFYCTRKQHQKSYDNSVPDSKFTGASNDDSELNLKSDNNGRSTLNGSNNSDNPSNDINNNTSSASNGSNNSSNPSNASNNSSNTSNNIDNISSTINDIFQPMDTNFTKIFDFSKCLPQFRQYSSGHNSSEHRFIFKSSDIEYFLNSQDPLSAQELLYFCKNNKYKYDGFPCLPSTTEQMYLQQCINKIKSASLYKNDPYREKLVNYLYDLKQGKQTV